MSMYMNHVQVIVRYVASVAEFLQLKPWQKKNLKKTEKGKEKGDHWAGFPNVFFFSQFSLSFKFEINCFTQDCTLILRSKLFSHLSHNEFKLCWCVCWSLYSPAYENRSLSLWTQIRWIREDKECLVALFMCSHVTICI